MPWTDGKPWVVTKEQTKLHWGGTGVLVCRLCDHIFKAGDMARFIFANFKGSPSHYGNFFVCAECDTGDVETILEKAGAQEKAAAALLRQLSGKEVIPRRGTWTRVGNPGWRALKGGDAKMTPKERARLAKQILAFEGIEISDEAQNLLMKYFADTVDAERERCANLADKCCDTAATATGRLAFRYVADLIRNRDALED